MKQMETANLSAVRYSVASSNPVCHQLVIFPHAGGGAEFYRGWRQFLPDDVDLIVLQYPERGKKEEVVAWGDPLMAIQRCKRGLANLLGIAPVTFFGHSMGALLALHVAEVMATSRFNLYQIILSAQKTPRALGSTLSTLEDMEQLVTRAMRAGGVTNLEKLDTETSAFVASAVKRDLHLLKGLAKLHVNNECQLRIFGGIDDPLISAGDLADWRPYLRPGINVELFTGGHFYFKEKIPTVVSTILRPYRAELSA